MQSSRTSASRPPVEKTPGPAHELRPPGLVAPEKGPPARMALPRLHQRHALLFAAGGGGVLAGVRPHRNGIAPDLRRNFVGGLAVCRHHRTESELDARVEEPRA